MRQLIVGASLGVAAIACHSAQPRLNDAAASIAPPPVSVTALDCQIYFVALSTIYPESLGKRPVLMDSSFHYVFQSAFNAWTGMRAPTIGPGATIVPATLDSLRAANRERQQLPPCLGAASYAIIPTDTLKSLFSKATRQTGWDRFYTAYVNAAGFTGLSRVSFNGDSTEAVVYVAHHAHWLNGRGDVLRLRRVDGQWTVMDRRVVWQS